MTNVLAIRADSFSKNIDTNRYKNAWYKGTGPWKIHEKRLWKDRCWVVLYRDGFPDIIATVEKKPKYIDPSMRWVGKASGYWIEFDRVLTVPEIWRYDCKPWGERRNPLYYTTLDEILPEDMEEDYLELLKVEDWGDYTIHGDLQAAGRYKKLSSMPDFNQLYLHVREKFYEKIHTKQRFDLWLQDHTVMDYCNDEADGNTVMIVRKTVNETHHGDVEFHDTFWCVGDYGDVWQTDGRRFEELLRLPLSVREGHAEVVRDPDRVDINGMIYS